jgi:gliding motility-associated lipoprotein GldD
MKTLFLWCILVAISMVIACSNPDSYTPKPRGYYHIDLPKKAYRTYTGDCPFTFNYPVYATMAADSEQGAANCWNNMSYPQFNARLHLTYYAISSMKEYAGLVEDARTLAFKHTVKASAIDQKLINYPDKKVYGIYYAIEGNTASSVQFFLTDSAKHYFRGALYFNERPQYDSIAPVLKFIKQDVDVMISTFKWKNK